MMEDRFEQAIGHHQAGRLAEAEAFYREILTREPGNANVLRLRGVLAHQSGNWSLAIELINQAIALAPKIPEFYANLGEVHQAAGHLDQATEAYRQAIALRPRSPDLWNTLGNGLREGGDFQAAVEAYRRAIDCEANYFGAWYNLGLVFMDQEQWGEAIVAYGQAIRLNPNQGEFHNNLGNALRANQQFGEAVASYRRAIALPPPSALACYNLGIALHEMGELLEAADAYRQAIALNPAGAEAYNNLGNVLKECRQLPQAVEAYRGALACRSHYPEALSNLGGVLGSLRYLDEAVVACRQAIALRPDYPEAYGNLGFALWEKGQLDESLAASRQAIALRPDYPEAYANLGNALKDMGKMNEAIAADRQALILKPEMTEVDSNLIYSLQFHPGFDALGIAEEHRRWHRQHAEPLRKFQRPHANDRDPDRRLRVGYVSPDFREQAESHFVIPLFAGHDQSRYEIHAYASVIRPDRITERHRASVSVWHEVHGLDDAELAEKIRGDGIDILVDLTMHMARNRLLVFARKPAPVQVTWLAYPGSTGLEAIDYRITDGWMDPREWGDCGCSEESVRLPDSWCCYDPLIELPQVPVDGAERRNFIRFGSLNHFSKLNEPLLSIWAQLLAAVPESRLLLLAAEGRHRDDLRQMLESKGIAGRRVEFVGPASRADYLRNYDRVDIALDPLPYNGITTTLDALWMGVPVVSLTGRTAASRAGLSLLTTLGLAELATHTPEEFVRVAAGLAGDLSRLAGWRSTLRQRMEASPLMDARRFAGNLEEAYRVMWCRWCETEITR